MSWKTRWSTMNPYDLHKFFINEYMLTKSGTTHLLQRDSSRDKRDIDVIRENHQFLWDESEEINSWEKKIAKKYYDRLFKEYCVGDLSRYKEDKFGLRWRTEKELVDGKGQFYCGARHCEKKEELRTWEVNFGYSEQGVDKSALVKLRLCPKCSKKLNHKFKKREVKRLKDQRSVILPVQKSLPVDGATEKATEVEAVSAWESKPEPADKSEDQQVDKFLQDLFL